MTEQLELELIASKPESQAERYRHGQSILQKEHRTLDWRFAEACKRAAEHHRNGGRDPRMD